MLLVYQSMGSALEDNDNVRNMRRILSVSEGFIHKKPGKTFYQVGESMSITNRIRRLYLQYVKEEDIKKLATVSLSHVRSLTVSHEAFHVLPALSSFPVLRVLDLNGCNKVDNHHCKDICNLFHLRYLRLCGTSVTEIPKEIANLQFLQVLDINSNEIEELPSTFVQLQQLVYLLVPYHTRLPDGFGNLKSLQFFPGPISIRSPSMLRDLGRLSELRDIIISFGEWDDIYLKPLFQCLSNLVSLEHLAFNDLCGNIDFGNENFSPGLQELQSLCISFDSLIAAAPRWISSLCSLSSVTISLLLLGDNDLRVLGSIPSLTYLSLWVEEPTQDRDKKLVIGNGYLFPCLTEFVVWHTMEVVMFGQGAMQKLQSIQFSICVQKTKDQFGEFEFGLENLTSLEFVSVGIYHGDAKPEEVEAAETAIRNAHLMNPNKPQLRLKKVTSSSMRYQTTPHNILREIERAEQQRN
ncbi:hypothetical protein ACP4OV_027198 [Aristida adscensionis]